MNSKGTSTILCPQGHVGSVFVRSESSHRVRELGLIKSVHGLEVGSAVIVFCRLKF